jgi:hypothetical protein
VTPVVVDSFCFITVTVDKCKEKGRYILIIPTLLCIIWDYLFWRVVTEITVEKRLILSFFLQIV